MFIAKKVYKCNYNAWKIMATSKLFKHCTFHQFQLKYIKRNLEQNLRFGVKVVFLSEFQLRFQENRSFADLL